MWLARWLRPRRKRELELEEEIQIHLQMAVSDRIERGENNDHAVASAHREFGNIGLIKEVPREKWKGAALEQLLRDANYGWRTLRKNLAFTVVAVLFVGRVLESLFPIPESGKESA